jgi:glutamyl-tRNA synthetase
VKAGATLWQATEAIAPLVQERSRTMEEAAELLRFLFQNLEPDEKARKALAGQEAYLAEVADRLARVDEWKAATIEEILRALQEERGLSARKAFQPIRAAVTGRVVTPPLFESMELLGRDRTLERLRAAA